MFRKESTWQKLAKPVTSGSGGQVVRGGLAAGATFLAVSVASAVTSAVRRRGEES
ncbi:hypothetical protein [Nocardioides euryhalodurans]|uniref:hypothetical protein n=1 Tax=Nocardioides euryhalodurans TaxID=2518370 RepID=UPI001421A79F|nr:hypothetical protein [Nocardioides euryhalodurans]